MNKLYKKGFFKTLIIIVLVILFLLFGIEGKLNDPQVIKDLVKEFVIVIGAAIVVSLYFEFHLRKEISEEFNNIMEAKEEFGKAGIVKYYSNFKSVDFRSYLDRDLKEIDFYLTYGKSLFSNIEDKLEKLCAKKDICINIYLLSKENPFIEGLGQLWGKTNTDYNVEGIKKNIDSTVNLLTLLFEKFKKADSLKANVKVYSLKRHPIFYSFYRFDNEIIFVPSKLIEEKSFVPLAFLTKRTTHSDGIFNKCLYELNNIKADTASLELIYDSKNG